jgi:ribosomal protein L3 glutamine methyltransferase
MDSLPDEFKKEPQLALYGGIDGLNFVEILLKEAPKHLKEHGVLIVEAVRKIYQRRICSSVF